LAFRLIRFIAMIGAAIFGLYGLVLIFILIVIHLGNLTSFGLPYLTPFVPQLEQDWKDLVLRAPITFFGKRPQMYQAKDPTRFETGDSP
jgi:spore germination protein